MGIFVLTAARLEKEGKEEKLVRLKAILGAVLLLPHLRPLSLKKVHDDNRTFIAAYDPNNTHPEIGTPVFLDPRTTETERLESGELVNTTYPLKAVAHIMSWTNHSVQGHLDARLDLKSCWHRAITQGNSTLLVPDSLQRWRLIGALTDKVIQAGVDSVDELDKVKTLSQQFHLVQTLLSSKAHPALHQLGYVDTILSGSEQWHVATSGFEQRAHEGDRVCLIAQRRQGNFFSRKFNLPSIKPGERVVLQFTVTGHGWQGTTEQCGEVSL